MKTEDWNLLKRDLCARLPYGVIIQVPELFYATDVKLGAIFEVDDDFRFTKSFGYLIENVKPYLRSMSSMTEEECVELSKIRPFDDEVEAWKYIKTPVPLKIANIKHFDFFHSHYLDWRGLIEKGLALEAPKDMYNIK